jgi:hypothetical protein
MQSSTTPSVSTVDVVLSEPVSATATSTSTVTSTVTSTATATATATSTSTVLPSDNEKTPVVAAPVSAPVSTPAAALVPVAKPTSLDAAFQTVTSNAKYVADIAALVASITKDGKVTLADVPQIVLVISDAVKAMNNIYIEAELVSDLLKKLFDDVVTKNNLLDSSDTDRLVKSSITLLMTAPVIKKELVACCAPWSKK